MFVLRYCEVLFIGGVFCCFFSACFIVVFWVVVVVFLLFFCCCFLCFFVVVCFLFLSVVNPPLSFSRGWRYVSLSLYALSIHATRPLGYLPCTNQC